MAGLKNVEKKMVVETKVEEASKKNIVFMT